MSSPDYFPEIMCDIESGGTSPDRTPMIQLAAVRFNLEHLTIDASNTFNRCLRIPPHRFWDESTRLWWSNQKQEILESIIERAEDPRVVMNDFFEWSCIWSERRFWAKPISFDFPFVSSYFKDYDFVNPYHYRVAKDVNTFVSGLWFPEQPPEVPHSDLGDAHDALTDCLMQIEHLFHHVQMKREQSASDV